MRFVPLAEMLEAVQLLEARDLLPVLQLGSSQKHHRISLELKP